MIVRAIRQKIGDARLDESEPCRDLIVQSASGLSQADRPVRTFEKRVAGFLFQIADGVGHCRLAHAQFATGLGEGTKSACRFERDQRTEGGQKVPQCFHKCSLWMK